LEWIIFQLVALPYGRAFLRARRARTHTFANTDHAAGPSTRGEAGLDAYRRGENVRSIDALPTGLLDGGDA
jgi:hypothetical protein